MLPVFNPNAFHSSQLQQPNGASSSTPQQMIPPPNPMQMGSGVLNPQFNQFAPNQYMNNNSNINFNAGPPQLGQFLPQNSLNPNQIFNQNVNLGQWSLPNPMPNMNMNMGMNANPLLAMGMPGLGQLPPGITPQNLAFLASAQLGLFNANQMGNMGLQLQGNMGSLQGFGLPQVQQNQQNFNQASAQVNAGKVANDNQSGNWRKTHNKNYNQNAFPDRSVKPPFNSRQHGKGNLGPRKDLRGKGHQSGGPKKCAPPDPIKAEKKRPLLLTYTEQEIQQWREERRKNHPSKANSEKKSTENQAASVASDEAAKLRRQRLKEILAKQAELGCEVAEIPSSYLSDSEQQGHGRGVKRPFNKKERFQNKFNKKGKFHQNDHFTKTSRSGNSDPSSIYQRSGQLQKQTCGNTGPTSSGGVASRSEPTLLQKLLSADIRRDRHHLLQSFRFMVMNSFFKDGPEKPLKFPEVIIKETGNQGEMPEGHDVIGGIKAEDGPGYGDDDEECTTANHDREISGLGKQEISQEEEGEIID